MGKVIVITGGGSGLGKRLARHFVSTGYSVVLLGRTLSKLEALAAELGDLAMPIACDIGSPDAVRATFAKIAEKHGQIDALINNAVVNDYLTLVDSGDQFILDAVSTNLTGPLLCSRSAIGIMRRGGNIINVSSESVAIPYPLHVVYQATKGGLEVMARHLKDEVKPLGLRVSLVTAGPMKPEDRGTQTSPEANAAFFAASKERGMDLTKMAMTRYDSILWIFQALIDLPADIDVDTIRFTSRHP